MNLSGIWQAAYTAGVVLPKPVATATYYHRALQPKKLVAVNFTRLAVRLVPCDSSPLEMCCSASTSSHTLCGHLLVAFPDFGINSRRAKVSYSL